MDDKKLEYIILYIIVGCVSVVIGAIARISAFSAGFDDFTANVIFLIAVAISIGIYLSIQLLVNGVLLSLIGKIPYFKRRIKTESKPIDIPPTDLNEVRNQQLQANRGKKVEALSIALQYTKLTFAPYATNAEIERLCSYITLYADDADLKGVKPIKVNSLSTIDIYHFGWNIWNHFKIGNQYTIAHFLKLVFADTLRDIEDEETIKKKLKVFESKCIIQIQENLPQ